MSRPPLFNVDSALNPLTEDEISADLIEARICSLAFKNFDFMDKRLPFVLDICTHIESNWRKLVDHTKHRYWIRHPGFGVLVFDANYDCGYMRTYRFVADAAPNTCNYFDSTWLQIKDEETFYRMLDTPIAKSIFDAWINHKNQVTSLPTEFVTGRLNNTAVEKAFVFSKGDGCVVCGIKATCYAATTVGESAALLVQLPVCEEHMRTAKVHPTIFDFLASLFHLSLDWPELVKKDSIPDELIPILHSMVAAELGALIGAVEKRHRGWHLTLHLPSGWKWLLRLNSLTDYAYMLFEPGRKVERYRADSAPDHPDVSFFPNHQHAHPGNKKKDEVTPSFLYGHPLFDIKRLRDAGKYYGAY